MAYDFLGKLFKYYRPQTAVRIETTSTTQVGLDIKGKLSTTADLARVRKSDGTVVFKVDATGVLIPIAISLLGAAPATAANYTTFFIADRAYTITAVRESHTAAGTDAGAVTLDVEKLTGTQAQGAGVAVLGATKINLKGAVNTVQAPALSGTAADLDLAAGDRLALTDAGVLTAVAGLTLVVSLKLK